MPRDLPTRRVFVSRSHFVSFIPLSTTTCGLRPRSGRSGDALPRCFLRWALPRCSCPTPFADVWDIQHVPCLALFIVRVETLAFIRKKIKKYKLAVILFFWKKFLVYHGRIAGPTFPTVSWSDEGTIMTSLNSTSSRKLTVPAILLPHAKTGRHCTTSYHWNPLG